MLSFHVNPEATLEQTNTMPITKDLTINFLELSHAQYTGPKRSILNHNQSIQLQINNSTLSCKLGMIVKVKEVLTLKCLFYLTKLSTIKMLQQIR